MCLVVPCVDQSKHPAGATGRRSLLNVFWSGVFQLLSCVATGDRSMERRCASVVARLIVCTVLCLCLAISCSGCGGGTTGTSSIGELKFSGVAEDADGTRAGELTMTVRSGGSDEALVDSGTNKNGEFAMDLPASEERIVVEVDGVGSTSIARQQRGDGTMSAKLAVTKEGTLTSRQFSESQVDRSTLCARLEVSGNIIRVVGPVGTEPCIVDIIVASEELSLESFTGTVRGVCSGTRTVVQESRAEGDGRLRLDLNRAFLEGCEGLEVVVRSSQTPELASIFVVQ
jgi:hypothetical protein